MSDSFGLRWLAVATLCLVACRRETSSPRRSEAAPSATAARVVSGSASSPPSAPPSATPLASALPSAAPIEHCKAAGKSSTASLGFAPGEKLQLLVDGGNLYVLSFTHALARVRWSRVSRAGGRLETVAEQKGLGDPSRAVVLNGAAYYTQSGNLFRVGGELGASVKLYERAHSPLALHVDRLFFMDCDRKGRLDRLVELPLSGAPARSLAEFEHAPGSRCEYSSLVADEREVLVADWRGQRILAVSRQDGAQRELLKKRGFPQALLLEPRALTFLSTRGLERVDRSGANPELLLDSELVLAPYSSAFLFGAEYWLTDDIAYSRDRHLYRRPYDSGNLRTFATFRVADPLSEKPGDVGLIGFAVDDECAYLARWRYGQPAAELLAMAK